MTPVLAGHVRKIMGPLISNGNVQIIPVLTHTGVEIKVPHIANRARQYWRVLPLLINEIMFVSGPGNFLVPKAWVSNVGVHMVISRYHSKARGVVIRGLSISVGDLIPFPYKSTPLIWFEGMMVIFPLREWKCATASIHIYCPQELLNPPQSLRIFSMSCKQSLM